LSDVLQDRLDTANKSRSHVMAMAIQKQKRIEELEESNKELTLQLLATSGQAADALDKLAEAMGSLREIITRWDTPAWKDAEATGSVINRARTKLAELEAKNVG